MNVFGTNGRGSRFPRGGDRSPRLRCDLRELVRTGWRSVATTSLVGLALTANGCQTTGWFARSEKTEEESQPSMVELLNAEASTKSGTTEAADGLSIAEHLQKGEQLLGASLESEDAGQRMMAQAHFNAILAQEPEHAIAHHRLAVIADLEKDFTTATQHYAKALRHNPNDPQLLHDVGYSYLLQEQPQQAIPYLEQSLTAAPTFELAGRKLADAYVRTNQLTQAEQTLARFLPREQAAAEVAELRLAHDPAAKPSLFGRVRENLQDLRPAPQEEEDPTQTLLAEMQAAKIAGQQAREQQQMQRAQAQARSAANTPAMLEQHGRGLHDSQLSQAMAQIELAGQRMPGQPILLDSGPSQPGGQYYAGGTQPYGNAHSTSPWQGAAPRVQGGVVQNPAAQYAANPQQWAGNNASMSLPPEAYAATPHAGQQPLPAEVMHGGVSVATAQPYQNAPAQGTGGMAEMYLRTERGVASSWPSSSAQRGPAAQGMPTGLPTQGDSQFYDPGIQQAGGARWTPGAVTSRADYQVLAGGQTQSPGYAQGGSPPGNLGTQTTSVNGAPSDEYRAAATMAMGVGPSGMFPVMRQTERLTPGTQSIWNGSQLPQAGRYLPTDRPPADLSRAWVTPGSDGQPGLSYSGGPNSLGQQLPAASQQWTHSVESANPSGWGVESQFTGQLPTAGQGEPLPAFQQMRADYNAQLNSRIQQVQGQYPGNAIPTPSTGLPMDRPGPAAGIMNNWYGESSPYGSQPAVGNSGGYVVPSQYPSSQTPSMSNPTMNSPSVQPQWRGDLPAANYSAGVVVPEAYQPYSQPVNVPGAYQGSAAQFRDGPVISPGR
jgi:Flp pilus assembly protein TadD